MRIPVPRWWRRDRAFRTEPGLRRFQGTVDRPAVSTGKFSAMTNAPIWGEEETLSLPQLEGEVDADVCVVGLGGSGLVCVRTLLEAGRGVVGIDAATVAGAAAGRNGGFLLGGLAMFHHDAVTRLGRPTAVAIYEQTLNQIDRMAAETPTSVRRTGTLRIAESAAEQD